ncbi:hypothetical protein JRQ81_016719, partial [Phrynocephalus forsythii]
TLAFKRLLFDKIFPPLFETVLEVLDAKYPNLKENITKWKPDIASLTDLFTKFNEVNLKLKRDSLNVIKAKSITAAFLARINLMKQNFGWREFSQFHNLLLTNVQDDDILVYIQHLCILHTDFKTKSEGVLTMEIPQWIINPYGDIEEADVTLQKELIGISINKEFKVHFRMG